MDSWLTMISMVLQVNKVKVAFKDSKFNFEALLGISKAGAGLFKWVNAMVNYHAVAKTVEPKRKKVAEAEKSLRIASKDLIKTQEEVTALNAELETLNKNFSEKSMEQQELKEKADLMERRLTAASKLIVGLSSEQTRWTQDMEMLDARRVRFLDHVSFAQCLDGIGKLVVAPLHIHCDRF